MSKLSAILIAAALSAAGVLAASAAHAAACPPGYEGTPPKCVPKQAKSRPAPVSSVQERGVISTGGKNAINPHAIPPKEAKGALPHPAAPIEKQAGGH